MPNRTWDAAREQMLLLYGASDKGRRASGHNLIEFFRVQSAQCPYRTKLEIEQYFRDFQYIGAPQVKQRRITTIQRDLIKEWFISRVPESQRTCSNPIPLADSLGILYGYFDPNALFPDLWDALDNAAEPEPIPTTRMSLKPLVASASVPPMPSTTLHPVLILWLRPRLLCSRNMFHSFRRHAPKFCPRSRPYRVRPISTR